MEKNIKAIGFALAAFPFGLAMAGLLLKVGWIQSSEPWSWATLKGIVFVVCGAVYFFGLKLLNAGSEDPKNSSEGGG